MVAKEQVEIYLKLSKEQIEHITAPLFIKKNNLKEQVREQKEQLDHKNEIIIHKDNICVQQKQSIDELTRELKRAV